MMFDIKLRCDFPDLYPSVLFDESLNFLLILFSYDTPQLTAAWMISNVWFSIFKVFHSPSNTAAAHLDISIHTTKLLIDVSS
jgi:hypothetical protein